MLITEVDLKLCKTTDPRLLAFCSIVFDGSLRIEGYKLIKGRYRIFVAMPSRKLTDHCTRVIDGAVCNYKNPLRVRFCGKCGTKLAADHGRRIFNRDTVYPLTPFQHQHLEEQVMETYAREKELSRAQDYEFLTTIPEEERDDREEFDPATDQEIVLHDE